MKFFFFKKKRTKENQQSDEKGSRNEKSIVENRTMDGLPSFYRVFMGFTLVGWVFMGFTEISWVLLGFNWVLLSFIGYSWVLPSFTGFSMFLMGFYRVLAGSSGFLLEFLVKGQGFTELLLVLRGFT